MRKKNWIRFWAAALSLVLLLGMTACANTEKDWQAQYDLGMRYLEDGDFEEAILAFAAAIEIDPNRPEAYMGRAEAYIAIDKPDEALKDYKRAKRAAKKSDDFADLLDELEDLIDELEDWIEEWEEHQDEDGTEGDWPLSDDWNPVEEDETGFQITVTDAYQDYLVDYYSGECCYHIPQIHLEDDRAAAVNGEIYRELYTILEDVYEHRDHYGYISWGSMLYQWAVKDDIVSLVVEVRRAEYHWVDYYVYNVSTATGQRVSDAYLIEACGMDMTAYYTAAEAAVRASYSSLYSGDIIDGMDREFYDSLVESSCSRENLENSKPYISENGELCMAVTWYSPAGASYYWELLGLEQQTNMSWFQCTVDHSADADSSTGFTAEEITEMVAQWYNNNLGGYESGYFTASDQETFVSDGVCNVVVRFVNTDPGYTGSANTLVAMVAVDMSTGEMWADGYRMGNLW